MYTYRTLHGDGTTCLLGKGQVSLEMHNYNNAMENMGSPEKKDLRESPKIPTRDQEQKINTNP